MWIHVHPPPGLEASSLGTRSSTTGYHRHSMQFQSSDGHGIAYKEHMPGLCLRRHMASAFF